MVSGLKGIPNFWDIQIRIFREKNYLQHCQFFYFFYKILQFVTAKISNYLYTVECLLTKDFLYEKLIFSFEIGTCLSWLCYCCLSHFCQLQFLTSKIKWESRTTLAFQFFPKKSENIGDNFSSLLIAESPKGSLVIKATIRIPRELPASKTKAL